MFCVFLRLMVVEIEMMHCWNKSYGEEGRKPSAMTLSQFEELKKTVGQDPTAPQNLIAAGYDGDEFISLQK